MRIAFVTSEYVTEKNFDGGLSNYIHRVSLSLLKLGHQPVVFVTSDHDEIFMHKGVEVHRVFVKKAPIIKKIINFITYHYFREAIDWLEQSYFLNKSLKKESKKEPFDIVQYPNHTAIGLFRVKNISSVMRISSFRPLCKKALGQDIPLRYDKFTDNLENIAFKKADGIFGPSRVVAKIVEKATEKKVEIIETPFVMDTTELNDSIYQRELADKKYLMYWGTVAKYKGLMTIVEIIGPLLEKHPDLHFVFVGKDPERKMIGIIKEKAGKFANRVIYFDRLDHSKLYPIIKGALAAVFPSIVENFSNVCIEAMAHKKIVIGTDGTSFEQLIDDGKSGFLFKPEDGAELLATIEKVLALSDEERIAIGEKAFERTLDLKPEKVVKQLVEYYNKVIANKKR